MLRFFCDKNKFFTELFILTRLSCVINKNKLLLTENTHSNNSKIAKNINKNLIFCITNLIKIVALDITSNKVSFKKLLPEAEPLT